MARPDLEALVTVPLLDRLTDLEPKVAADSPVTRAQSVRNLKAALRRDLEWLFNTRSNPDTPMDMREVVQSVYNYGLPDYTHYVLTNPNDRMRLQKRLEIAISYFEPRLTGVTVRLLDTSYEAGKALRFHIDGLLKMDPAPELISFDTVLDLPTGEYQVKGDSSAR
ncbi:MAG: type VI secretion system baseplate subunit TssE [Bryobacteraceae bacterium]